ncbi:asparagine synthase-related protein [Rhizobium sullae]|uniref:asparagine synthase-related protein n=1 Tax=Rhizobium sullae TaxID=50338 RepID=UPI001404E0ED|nr:asparagine synthase-related protein [Rhizobium sullae]
MASEFHEEGITLLRSVVNEALLKQTSIWGVLYAWLSRRSDRSMTRWIESDLDNITSVLRFLKYKHLFPSDTFTDAARYKRLSISRRFQICTLNDAKYNSLAEVLGICERKPFLYWPLVRFCISCPRSILFGGGRERGLFRHAFSDVLPRSVANRIGKSGDLNVPNLFDYEAVKNKILASDFMADFLNMDAVAAINPHHLDDETAEFIMRCATVDAYLKTL